jgi:glycerol-3-phosphate dehydrogenase
MLNRDVRRLADESFDILIVGGGIYGACAAWEAASRGLKAALVEKHDFCTGSSAKMYKMIHGGLRYMQHADLPRVISSSRERTAFLTIAPHLAHPVPIVIPTYGHAMRGKEILRIAVAAYSLLTLNRNGTVRDPERHVPAGRTMSRTELAQLFPDLPGEDLTGGVLFYDGQVHNPARLVLAFLQSAAQEGAAIANYVEAVELLAADGQVRGMRVQDRQSGDELEVRARFVLNTSGPWAPWLIQKLFEGRQKPDTAFSRDACFIVKRRFAHPYGLTLPSRSRDRDALLSRERRHLFVVPWRGEYSIIGTWHKVTAEHPERLSFSDEELEDFVAEVNDGYPGLVASAGEVGIVNYGLIPFGTDSPESTELSYGKRSVVIDHAKTHDTAGLLTVIGIRFTMGRGDAKTAIDEIVRRLGLSARASSTHRQPVFGGDFDSFNALLKDVRRAFPGHGDPYLHETIAHHHGTGYAKLAGLIDENPALGELVPGTHTLAAEVVNAVRNEMAVTVSDVIFRRTGIGTGDVPDSGCIEIVAGLCADELGWSDGRRQIEIARVIEELPQISPSSALS